MARQGSPAALKKQGRCRPGWALVACLLAIPHRRGRSADRLVSLSGGPPAKGAAPPDEAAPLVGDHHGVGAAAAALNHTVPLQRLDLRGRGAGGRPTAGTCSSQGADALCPQSTAAPQPWTGPAQQAGTGARPRRRLPGQACQKAAAPQAAPTFCGRSLEVPVRSPRPSRPYSPRPHTYTSAGVSGPGNSFGNGSQVSGAMGGYPLAAAHLAPRSQLHVLRATMSVTPPPGGSHHPLC